MILLVPSLSSFSMRQVQELAITLSLSATSLILLVVTLLLGTSSVWRDVERRYTTSIMTLPLSRGAFLLSKFISIALFLIICVIVLGLGSALVILLASASYPSEIPIHWGNICLALVRRRLEVPAAGFFRHTPFRGEYVVLPAFFLHRGHLLLWQRFARSFRVCDRSVWSGAQPRDSQDHYCGLLLSA